MKSIIARLEKLAAEDFFSPQDKHEMDQAIRSLVKDYSMTHAEAKKHVDFKFEPEMSAEDCVDSIIEDLRADQHAPDWMQEDSPTHYDNDLDGWNP